MSEQGKLTTNIRTAAISEAHRVAAPLRKALKEARIASIAAKAKERRLDAECVAVWEAAYENALKAREGCNV